MKQHFKNKTRPISTSLKNYNVYEKQAIDARPQYSRAQQKTACFNINKTGLVRVEIETDGSVTIG